MPATPNPYQRGSIMMKIYTMYVHQEYSQIEIGRKLHLEQSTVGNYLKKIEKISPELRRKIRLQRKKNERDSSYKSHLVRTPEWMEA